VAAPQKEIDVKTGEVVTKEANPAYAKWLAQDQQILGYLLTTMMREALLQVGAATTAAEL
jgi:hypothetical protein